MIFGLRYDSICPGKKQEYLYRTESDLAIISPEEFAEAKRAFAAEMFAAEIDEDECEER